MELQMAKVPSLLWLSIIPLYRYIPDALSVDAWLDLFYSFAGFSQRRSPKLSIYELKIPTDMPSFKYEIIPIYSIYPRALAWLCIHKTRDNVSVEETTISRYCVAANSPRSRTCRLHLERSEEHCIMKLSRAVDFQAEFQKFPLPSRGHLNVKDSPSILSCFLQESGLKDQGEALFKYVCSSWGWAVTWSNSRGQAALQEWSQVLKTLPAPPAVGKVSCRVLEVHAWHCRSAPQVQETSGDSNSQPHPRFLPNRGVWVLCKHSCHLWWWN